MKNSKGFNLITVIIIICVVSIISGLTTGIIVTNTYSGISSDDDALNEFLRVYSDITNNYYEDIDKEEMLDQAMDAMLNYLGDSYTTYLNKEEKEALEEKLSGSYRGIGVTFKNRTVVSVTEGSPAEEAGLMAGDIFIKIDDTDVSSYADTQISYLIKNNENDIVKIGILRNSDELSFNVELKNLEKNNVSSLMIENTTIGYIDIPIFAKDISNQAKKAIDDLENAGMTKLIIDLRDDSGGYLDEAQSLANIFLEKGKIIYSLEDKEGLKNYRDDTDEKKTYPIAVLLNGNSASASEILASALKDSYGATIVGTKSYGKGKVQQTYSMSDGSMAKYTSAKWYRPNGSCIDGIGITPDYVIELEKSQDENGEEVYIDTQLEKALEVLGHDLVSFLINGKNYCIIGIERCDKNGNRRKI